MKQSNASLENLQHRVSNLSKIGLLHVLVGVNRMNVKVYTFLQYKLRVALMHGLASIIFVWTIYQSKIIMTHYDYNDSLTLEFTNSYIILPQFYTDLAWFCLSVIFLAGWELYVLGWCIRTLWQDWHGPSIVQMVKK